MTAKTPASVSKTKPLKRATRRRSVAPGRRPWESLPDDGIKLTTAGRRMTGQTLHDMRMILNIRTLDLMWLVGFYAAAFAEAKDAKNISLPIPFAPRSIMIRLIMEMPQLNLLEQPPSPLDLLTLIRSIDGYQQFPKKNLPAMLGMEKGSIYRYSQGGVTSPIVERLLLIIYRQLKRVDISMEEKKQFLDLTWAVAVEEARLRGIPDEVFRTRGFVRTAASAETDETEDSPEAPAPNTGADMAGFSAKKPGRAKSKKAAKAK